MTDQPEDALLREAKTAAVSEGMQWIAGLAEDTGADPAKLRAALPELLEAAAFAAVQAERRVAAVRDIARDAEVLHSEHHPGTFVPTLDSCPVHERADYEQRVREIASRSERPRD